MRTISRRSAVVVALVLVASLLGARGAEARTRAVFSGSGTHAGHGVIGLNSPPGCSFASSVIDSSFSGEFDGVPGLTAGDTGTLHQDTCVADPGSSFISTGTFVLRTALGTLSGTIATTATIGFEHPMGGWIVTKGTGAYAHAKGSIDFSSDLVFDGHGGFDESGTMSADVQTDTRPLLLGVATATRSTSSSVGGGGCSDVQTVTDGTFKGRVARKGRTSGTYHAAECVDTAGVPVRGLGTFTLTTRAGTLQGTTDTVFDHEDFSQWTVTSGTGAYADATGFVYLVTIDGSVELVADVVNAT